MICSESFIFFKKSLDVAKLYEERPCFLHKYILNNDVFALSDFIIIDILCIRKKMRRCSLVVFILSLHGEKYLKGLYYIYNKANDSEKNIKLKKRLKDHQDLSLLCSRVLWLRPFRCGCIFMVNKYKSLNSWWKSQIFNTF